MENHFFKTVTGSVKHWYIPLIVGLLFIFCGIWVFMTPVESYLTLAMLFSVAFFVAGLSEILFALSNRKELDNWGWMLFSGIFNFLVGLILLIRPDISAAILPFYVGFTLLFRSIQAIGVAYDLKNYGVTDWGNLALLGVLGMLLSFVMLWNPVFAGLSLVIWTGSAFLSMGVFGIYLSLRLQKLKTLSEKIPHELKQRYHEIKKEVETRLKN